MRIKEIDESLICAGFGGQGIMLLGKAVAEAAMFEGRQTTWMPSYGAEVRGGTAHSMVRVSSSPISSPLVASPDTCVVMNKPSFTKFIGMVKKNGLFIINSSMITQDKKRKDIDILNIPATDIAMELGSAKAANMVMFGAYIKKKNILSMKNALKAVEKLFSGKEELIKLNKSAVEKGAQVV